MEISNLAAGAEQFTSNAYRIGDSVLVDTGADPVIVEQLAGTDLETIVITHSHHDHIENLPAIIEDHPEATVLAAAPANLPVEATEIEDTVELAGTTWDVIATPGHRDDSICLYAPSEKILFSGDLIFPGGSFGRTDLEEGDRDRLIESIETITDLDVRALYPGHNEPTTEDVNDQIRQSLENAREREPKYD